MKIKKFNESIVDYKSDNIVNFYNEIRNLARPTFNQIVEIGNKYEVEVVDYDTFYDNLSEIDKSTAPPRNEIPAFAFANNDTGKPCVVFGDMFTNQNRPAPIDPRLIDHVYHMLKHENVHLKQQSKRPGYTKPMPDPKDRGRYFSDTDEIMAFSQSIVDLLMNMGRATSVKDGISKLKKNPLYNDIKRRVSTDVLKKYHKYIYLYLEKEFEPAEEIKENAWATPHRLSGSGEPTSLKINQFIDRYNDLVEKLDDWMDEEDLWDDVYALYKKLKMSDKELHDIIVGGESGKYNVKSLQLLKDIYSEL